jgi:hypothetical protein
MGVTLALTRAGWQYFGGAAGLMAIGWLVAPMLIPLLGLSARASLPLMPSLLRAAWFLVTYYVFIFVHQLVKARGAAVFGPAGGAAPES